MKSFESFCGETLSWINVIFSGVKSFSCFTMRLFSGS